MRFCSFCQLFKFIINFSQGNKLYWGFMKGLIILLLAIIMTTAFAGLFGKSHKNRSECSTYCSAYWDCFGKAHVSGESEDRCILPVNCGDCTKY